MIRIDSVSLHEKEMPTGWKAYFKTAALTFYRDEAEVKLGSNGGNLLIHGPAPWRAKPCTSTHTSTPYPLANGIEPVVDGNSWSAKGTPSWPPMDQVRHRRYPGGYEYIPGEQHPHRRCTSLFTICENPNMMGFPRTSTSQAALQEHVFLHRRSGQAWRYRSAALQGRHCRHL